MKLIQSRQHVLEVASSDNSSKILFNRELGISPRAIFSRYTQIYKNQAHSKQNEVIDLPPILYSFDAAYNALGAENALLNTETGEYYLEGISFATTSGSQAIMMEPILKRDFSDVCHLHFQEDITCIATYNVYGHFLLQTCFKLVALKILSSLNESLVVFFGAMPSRYFDILKVLDLLPERYVVCPNNTCVSSAGFISIPSSPINTVSTPLCKSMASLQSSPLDTRLSEGQFISSATWMNSRRGIGVSQASYLRQSVLSFAPERSPHKTSLKLHQKIYLPRKLGAHRGVANRDEIISTLSKVGYEVMYLEDYAAEEQICILQHCRHLIAEVGSTSCNTWLMPNLCSVIELSLTGAEIPWGPVLDSAVRPIKFYRIIGDRIEGTERRHDGDLSKQPMPQDADFQIPIESLEAALISANGGW